MNINHHPSDELLLDYAAGSLREGWSIAIATHLALCPHCRNQVDVMESIGGCMLDNIESPSMTGQGYDDLLHRLEGLPQEAPAAAGTVSEKTGDRPVFPEPLRGYLGCDLDSVRWQRLGRGAYQVLVPTQENDSVVRLLRIPAGRPVPAHTHGGLELTVVLQGAFSDATGEFGRGDIQEADETLQHQPHAAPGADCICLAVTDAPLQFNSLIVRMLQPILNI